MENKEITAVDEKIKKRKFKTIFLLIFLIFIAFASIFIYLKKGSNCEIISPQNTTYNRNNVIVSVSCEDPVLWIANSFDGGPNITECGNCNSYTRYDLIFTKGTHIVKAYANDFNNKIIELSVTFTVE